MDTRIVEVDQKWLVQFKNYLHMDERFVELTQHGLNEDLAIVMYTGDSAKKLLFVMRH